MACDEYFLNLAENKKISGILRLYTWKPVSISIGYFFKTKNLNMDAINKKKINVIRRITGGNLILHKEDLTYSLIMQKGIHNIQNKKEYYYFIANILNNALNDLKIKSNIIKNNDLFENNPDCFNSISQYEISSIDGKKLIGSSQTILKNSLLQHGSFIYNYNQQDISIFIKNSEIKNIKDSNTKKLNILKVTKAFKRQFNNYFNLIKYKLTTLDMQKLNNLIEVKYSKDEWNFRK